MDRGPMPCGALIKRINECLERNANMYLYEHKITFPQMKILMFLNETPGNSMPLKGIEHYFDVSQATIAGTVARLEKKGFVEGESDPNDKRVKLAVLTDEGRRVCQDAHDIMGRSEEALVHTLTEEERIIFRNVLEKVYMGLRNFDGEERLNRID